MAERDPAFQWETEALRAAARRRRATQRPASTSDMVEPGWVTIRQAEGATGIPVGTLRRWARQGALPSRSQDTDAGARRLVWLDAVLERATALGRAEMVAEGAEVTVPRGRSVPPPPPPPRPHAEPPVEIAGQQKLIVIDTIDEAPSDDGGASGTIGGQNVVAPDVSEPQPQIAAPPEAGDESRAGPPDPPPGTMLVPVDAWNKMLIQLGNLHEAGRDLAEARERAAKAETEATFLRERLKELRERDDADRSPAIPERRRRRWFGGR